MQKIHRKSGNDLTLREGKITPRKKRLASRQLDALEFLPVSTRQVDKVVLKKRFKTKLKHYRE